MSKTPTESSDLGPGGRIARALPCRASGSNVPRYRLSGSLGTLEPFLTRRGSLALQRHGKPLAVESAISLRQVDPLRELAAVHAAGRRSGDGVAKLVSRFNGAGLAA